MKALSFISYHLFIPLVSYFTIMYEFPVIETALWLCGCCTGDMGQVYHHPLSHFFLSTGPDMIDTKAWICEYCMEAHTDKLLMILLMHSNFRDRFHRWWSYDIQTNSQTSAQICQERGRFYLHPSKARRFGLWERARYTDGQVWRGGGWPRYCQHSWPTSPDFLCHNHHKRFPSESPSHRILKCGHWSIDLFYIGLENLSDYSRIENKKPARNEILTVHHRLNRNDWIRMKIPWQDGSPSTFYVGQFLRCI